MGRLTVRVATTMAVLAVSATAASTAAAADVPCSTLSAGKYQCSFYPPGDGISAGAPVQDSTGKRVGYLNHGANWIVCQASGATVHSGAYYNRWWGYTEANDHHFGWVNAVWASGGSNDGPFAMTVPNCGSTYGSPPAATEPSPIPTPTPTPAPKPVPCHSIGHGKHSCVFYPAGDGIHGGAPVFSGSKRAGFLNQGANWVICEQRGAIDGIGNLVNSWWGYTEANDHKWGWVNAIWARGGDNDQGFAGVPDCHGSKGYPPGLTPPKPKPKPKPEPPPKTMVALGDSYSSGEGTDPNSGFSCFRSPKAYGWLVASALGYRMTGFEACGGATTSSVLNDQLSAVNASTTLVTMSAGGNDADFVGVLGRCAGGFGLVTGPCKNLIKKESGIIRDQIPGRLDQLYSAIRAAAPRARVVIVDYPYLFSRTCVKSGPLQWLIAPTDLLDDVIKAAAARHGFSFVDVRGPFTGHSVCDQDAWINHLYTHNPYKSLHPNEAGYREDAKLVEAAL